MEYKEKQKFKVVKRRNEDQNKWPKKSKEYRLAHLVVSSTISISLFKNELFRDFLLNFDPCYKLPKSCGGVIKLLKKKYENTLKRIKIQLKTSLSIVLHIWKNTLKDAFIGETGFFYR